MRAGDVLRHPAALPEESLPKLVQQGWRGKDDCADNYRREAAERFEFDGHDLDYNRDSGAAHFLLHHRDAGLRAKAGALAFFYFPASRPGSVRLVSLRNHTLAAAIRGAAIIIGTRSSLFSVVSSQPKAFMWACGQFSPRAAQTTEMGTPIAKNRSNHATVLVRNLIPRFYPPARECNPATGGARPCILSEVWTSPTQAR